MRERDQPARVCIGEWPEQHAVHDAEHRRRCADPECQNEDGRDREARHASQSACGEAKLREVQRALRSGHERFLSDQGRSVCGRRTRETTRARRAPVSAGRTRSRARRAQSGMRRSCRIAPLVTERLDEIAIEGAPESRRIEMQQHAIEPLADVERRNAKVRHQASAGPARSAARAAAASVAMRSASAAIARRPSGVTR